MTISLKIYFFITIILLVTCTSPVSKYKGYEVTSKWADLTLQITKHTPSNSPTFASRCFGYIGLVMYESVVHGFDDYNSLAGQLNGLSKISVPNTDENYDWLISLNAGQARIIKNIYNQTDDFNKRRIDSLELNIEKNIVAHINDQNKIDRSKLFGQIIADEIFEWSKTDGGHRAYLRNFEKSLNHPTGKGTWKPPLYAQSFSHHPLHPRWGENRCFLKQNQDLAIPEMIQFNSDRDSDYFREFIHVYEKEQELTKEEKEAAIWWGDDPDESFTPPGHSYYITNIAVKKKKANLIHSASAYARVGIAVADAFIKCWKWKYHYFSERPNTFIPQYIDQEWESFWPDPPFPCFPSGHAIQASSAATVLAYHFGNEFSFIDSAHVGRERDELRNVDFKARHFNTFWEVAEETANSRFYGGIHTPQDNIVGLEQGKIIAENINQLEWKKATKK